MTTSTNLRSPFFEAGLEILGTRGYGGLKLAALCRSMGVTTGAFYHSFSSWKDFTSQLLEHWHEERTLRVIELTQQLRDPSDQLENLLQATIALPHQAEAAIRVWGTIDPDVGKVQESVDAERYAVIYPAFLELVGDPLEAETLSKAGMFLLIGYEQAESMRDPRSLEWGLRLILDAAAERSRARDRM